MTTSSWGAKNTKRTCNDSSGKDSGETLTAEEVLQHCLAHVPRFAIPRFIEFVEVLPRTPSNKVQKHLLRESGVRGCWDRDSTGHGARRATS